MPDTTAYSVLVVDDSPEQIRYISEILKPEGCRIYAATSSEAAFKILKKTLPDLIILDIVMPDMDGFEVCKRIKANPGTVDIPVIFATAYHDADYLGQGFVAGGCDYLVKPFIREELLERVKVRIRLAQKRVQLQEAYAELDKFCYTLSHDIRAPLYVIGQLAGLLKEEVKSGDPAEAENICNMLLDKANQAANMTEGLHRFSKALYENIDEKEVDLDEMFQEVYDELIILEPARKIDFQKESLPTVPGDPLLLRLVVQNIIGNALKFTRVREEAKLKVSAVREDTWTVVSLLDNGIGIDGASTEEVFQLFRKVHSRSEYEGDGIGLATVKRIMARHGGDVKAEPNPEGGTIIRLLFPRRDI